MISFMRLVPPSVLSLLAAAVMVGGVSAVSTQSGGGTPGPSRAAATFRLLVRTGQAAPDGGTFAEFSDPTNNGSGDLLFGAVVTDRDRVRETLYFAGGSKLKALLSSGAPAPTGGTFSTFSDLLLSDRGTIGFLAKTTDRVAWEGVYLLRAGKAVPIARIGERTPAGGVFTDFANPTINARDEVAFVGRMTGQEGIFINADGSTKPVLMSGQPAPEGGVFEFFLDGSPWLNDRGDMAFVASTTVHHLQGVYVLVDGQPATVVTTDDEAPVGGLFTEFGSVGLTNEGTVCFIGRSSRSATPEALYVTGRAVLVTLAAFGQAVEGGPLTKFANVVIDSREDVVFQLSLPIVPQALYLATRAGVRPIALAGDRAPGGGLFTAFSTPTLNDAGQVAFVAETDDGRHGIYVVTLP